MDTIDRRHVFASVSRWVLVAAVLLAGIAKATSFPDPRATLPAWGHYGMAVLDLAIAVGLATRFVRSACLILILLCFGGLAMAAWFPERPCGCLGTWARMAGSQHALFAAGIGALAGLVLSSRSPIGSGARPVSA